MHLSQLAFIIAIGIGSQSMSIIAHAQVFRYHFNPPDSITFRQADSLYKAYYWWQGQEDYVSRDTRSQMVRMTRTHDGYQIALFPLIDQTDRNIDSVRFLAQTTTYCTLDTAGNFLDLSLPPVLEARLSILPSNAASIQKRILHHKVWNDWYFRTGQFLGQTLKTG